MKKVSGFLIVLLFIVIIAASMMAYKIETFTNLSDPDVFPQSPDDSTAFNYLKMVKRWNTLSLTEQQKRVLFTMRALQSRQYASDTRVFPYKDGIVIPFEHLPVFNHNPNNTSQIVVNPPTVNLVDWIRDRRRRDPVNEQPPRSSPITIEVTEAQDDPEGLYLDLGKVNFETFKSCLNGLYELYDSEFLFELKHLVKDKRYLSDTLKPALERELQDLIAQTNHWNSKRAALDHTHNREPEQRCQEHINALEGLRNDRNAWYEKCFSQSF